MENKEKSVTNENVCASEKIITQMLAILGFIFSFSNVLPGFVLSILALKNYKKQSNKQYKGLAIAGVTISSIGFVTIMATVALYFFAILLDIIFAIVANLAYNPMVGF